jgi:PIN domain nuclease of toxin-antitoxin system
MILLDTCALLWLNEDRSVFSPVALAAIESNADALAVASISVFEIGIKVRRGKMSLPLEVGEWFKALSRRYGLIDLSVSASIAAVAAELPDIHRDPFDRLIIATACVRRLPIVSADKIIPRYSEVTVIW